MKTYHREFKGHKICAGDIWEHKGLGVKVRVQFFETRNGKDYVYIQSLKDEAEGIKNSEDDCTLRGFVKTFQPMAKIDPDKKCFVYDGTLVQVGDIWVSNNTPACRAEILDINTKADDLWVEVKRLDVPNAKAYQFDMRAFCEHWTNISVMVPKPGEGVEEEFTVSVDASGLICELECLIEEMEETDEMVHPEYIRGRLEQMLKSEVRD